MRILWHSNAPWVPSGYGTQTKLFGKRLHDILNHDVSFCANWGLNGSIMSWEGFHVFPSDDMWGNRLLVDLAFHQKIDLIIALLDAWLLKPNSLIKAPTMGVWVPVDHEPCPGPVRDFFKKAPQIVPIAMSKRGRDMLKDADLHPLYVPHGVNTKIYKPNSKQEEVRERIGLPKDAFVYGVVAQNRGTNPPRKSFPQILQAFAEISKKIPEAYLYLHCNLAAPHHDGLNLAYMIKQFKIPDDRVRCPTLLQMELGFNDNEMTDIYNMMDVLLSPSYGEGFGVPIIEAQACGTPVIVTNWTAMPELCGAGWLVEGEKWYHPAMSSFFKCPSVDSIVGAMEIAYQEARDPMIIKSARRFAEQYDADLITRKYWQPVLAELACKKKKSVV